MQQLYTSAEAARLLGISDGTIRSWLSRFPEVFEADKHLVVQEGKKLWTEQGLDLLRKRVAENAAKDAANNAASATEIAMNNAANINADATESATQRDANSDAQMPPHFAMLDGYLNETAAALAERFWQQLPERTMQYINKMMRSPTPQQQEVFKQSLQQSLQLLPTSEGKYPALPQAESYSLQ